jgi:hypothetical protein
MSDLGVPLVTIGLFLTAANWAGLIEYWRGKREIPGVCPFPSILVFGGCMMLPSLKPYGWLAFVIDYTVPCFLFVLPRLIQDYWQLSRFTRIRELRASDPPRLFVLTLHRRGHFYIKLTCDPPMGGNERGTGLASSGIMGRWEAIDDGFLLREYRDQRTLRLRQSGTTYVATENNYPQDKRYPIDSMSGLTFTVV